MQVEKILVQLNNQQIQKYNQKNPSFGKLFIDKSFDKKLTLELENNSEVKNLVKLFNNVGINLKAIKYSTFKNSCSTNETEVHLRLVDPKKYNHWMLLNNASRLKIDGQNDEEILSKLKNLPSNTADENFHNYYNYNYYPERFQNIHKKSFWNKLKNLL